MRHQHFSKLSVFSEDARHPLSVICVRHGGGKTQQSTSQVTIPPEVLARYNAVNAKAETVAGAPFTQYSTGPSAFVAPLTKTQQAGVIGTNAGAGEAQPFYQKASDLTLAGAGAANPGALNVGAYMNPYMGAVIAPTEALLAQQNQQALGGQLGSAINQGAFGGDREVVTAANLQQQLGLAAGQTYGSLLNQNYSQALGAAQQQQGVGLGAQQQNLARLQAAGAQEANIGAGAQAAQLSGAQAQLTAGQSQQQTEQAGLTALYNQFLQQMSYPFQTTQFLANIAEGTGALSGSTTTGTQPAPFFSDERLKEDIQEIGRAHDGKPIYRFRYKGHPQVHVGLMAHDVERDTPEAVGLHGGYKTVDYDAATAHMGGLVSPSGERRAYAYGGLSPNAGWEGGFYVDPSYLIAQEDAYKAAPWGNEGPVSGTTPGKTSYVPPSSGGVHASLSAAPLPRPGSSGVQQLAGGLKTLEQGVGTLGGLGNAARRAASYFGNQSPNSPASTGLGAPPPPTDASGGSLASASPPTPPDSGLLASAATPSDADFSGLTDNMFARRGGRMRRDSGGYIPPMDASSDDTSSGGDIAYDSGTGMKGMDIPDDRNVNKLVTAPLPSQSGSGDGGLGDIMKIGTGLLGIFGLRDGGAARKSRDSGGQTDDDASDIPGAPAPQTSPGGIGATLNANQSWLVPLAHGLGTMASSNSRYLGSAVLQGLGGAADSYEDVQNELERRAAGVPTIQAERVGAMSTLNEGWANYNVMHPGREISLSDYAKMVGYAGKVPQDTSTGIIPRQGAPTSPTGRATGSAQPAASPTPTYSADEYMNGSSVGPDGQRIPNNQNPGYLSNFISHNAMAAHLKTPLTAVVRDAQERYVRATTPGATILNSQGQIINPAGGLESAAQGKTFEGNYAQAQGFQESYPQMKQALDDLNVAYSNFGSGRESATGATLSDIGRRFGITQLFPKDYETYAPAYDAATKIASQAIMSQMEKMGGRASDMEADIASHGTVNTENAPAANFKIMAAQRATLEYSKDRYQAWQAAGYPSDTQAFTANWNAKHPMQPYMDQAYKDTIIPVGASAAALQAVTGHAIPVPNVDLRAQRDAKSPAIDPAMMQDGQKYNTGKFGVQRWIAPGHTGSDGKPTKGGFIPEAKYQALRAAGQI